MKKNLWIVAVVLVVLSGAAAWAQDGFAARLQVALRQLGWSEAEAGAVVRQQAEWRLAEQADPQAVALALAYADTQEEIGPQEQARLAVQAALMLREMDGLGIEQRVAVRTMLRATRQVMADLQAGAAEPAGDLLRLRLRDQLRLAEQDQARVRLQDRDRDRERPDGLVSGGPANGQQWGGPGGGRP